MIEVASMYCPGSEGRYRCFEESENSYYVGWEFNPDSHNNYHVEHFTDLHSAFLYMEECCKR